MGPTALLLIRRKACYGLLSPLKIHCVDQVEPANLRSSGKHANHYTTEATKPVSDCVHHHHRLYCPCKDRGPLSPEVS
jgi:hypothetical protein